MLSRRSLLLAAPAIVACSSLMSLRGVKLGACYTSVFQNIPTLSGEEFADLIYRIDPSALPIFGQRIAMHVQMLKEGRA